MSSSNDSTQPAASEPTRASSNKKCRAGKLNEPTTNTGQTRCTHLVGLWIPHLGLDLDRGMYTPLIVDDPADPGRYDAEAVLVLDDWLDGIDGSSPEVTYRNLLAGGAGKADVTGMSGMDHDQMNMKIDLGDIAYPLHLVNGRTRQDPPTVTVPAGGC